MIRRVLIAVLLVVAAPADAADCRERARLDAILNVDPAIWQPTTSHADDPVMRMYDIAGPWAVAVALGDYEGAQLLTNGVLPAMERLLESIGTSDEETDPGVIYHRTVVSGLAARMALVDHRFLRALRFGLVARDGARWLKARDPADPRPDFFLGLYHYYLGLAPRWLRAVGSLAGLDGDIDRGLALLERAVTSGQALAPEAARVLLEETRAAHRPACRYLSLARDLETRYPHNYRFGYYADREAERCPAGDADAAEAPPRLGPGCPGPAAGDGVPARP